MTKITHIEIDASGRIPKMRGRIRVNKGKIHTRWIQLPLPLSTETCEACFDELRHDRDVKMRVRQYVSKGED